MQSRLGIGDFKVEREIYLIDEYVREIYKIDILSAMLALNMVWLEFPADMVKKFWEKNKIIPVTDDLAASSNQQWKFFSEWSRLEGKISTKIPVQDRMAIDYLLPEEELTEEFVLRNYFFRTRKRKVSLKEMYRILNRLAGPSSSLGESKDLTAGKKNN